MTKGIIQCLCSHRMIQIYDKFLYDKYKSVVVLKKCTKFRKDMTVYHLVELRN